MGGEENNEMIRSLKAGQGINGARDVSRLEPRRNLSVLFPCITI